ncbi:unnamed protein product [Allacma fusca]|uniref:Cytoplasmic tRNA 2-thiolation protein 2 n=1 Tax=Allacma fusca TaxID=39272 RepID=A0A8J2PDG8_9HEXA|nr:unnamed protein product [Allacma fusca]
MDKSTMEGANNLVCFECTQLIEPESKIVHRLRRTYCRDCWIHHCNFRFRKRLFELGRPEKGSRIPANLLGAKENVLIDYDGSQSAIALVHLIRDAVRSAAEAANLPDQKNLPLPFTFSILFIHDDLIGNETSLKQLDVLRKWQTNTFYRYGLQFPIIVSSLETSLRVLEGRIGENEFIWRAISSQSVQDVEGNGAHGRIEELDPLPYTFPFNSPLTSRLTLIADSFRSKTCRQDFLQELRQNLLLFICKQLSVKRILVSEEQTCMAIKMFSMMSLGRGAQLAEQMSLTTQIQGVKLARPLMDLAQDDLRDYMECIYEQEKRTAAATEESFKPLSLPIDNTKNGKTVRAKTKTIYQQCEDFIVDLQKGYPSTVPTLTRIGAKLRPTDYGEPSCNANAEGMARPTGGSQTDATSFSPLTSVCSFCKKNRNDTEDQESHQLCLCYGCTNILRDMKDQSYFRELIQPM